MFDVTGDDIQRLGDADFRTLVARLAIAELSSRHLSVSAVTAGGHQDAKDGGIDVRVALYQALDRADFVPRAQTGYQVKKPDMPPGAIADEMRPNGVLRSSIAALADAGGAYIIVSAQGSLTDTALDQRRAAIRAALHDHPNGDKLVVDFYDRERIATWVNLYAGAATWVRARIGGTTSGWRPIGRWQDVGVVADKGYLVGESSRLVDERSRDEETLGVGAGIARLRDHLATPRSATRLIGMSGLGKTRLAEALFEAGVGENALDPALSVYTDYSDDIVPPAGEMARRLVDSGARAILVVDNCNPQTHRTLADICKAAGQVSLLTIEYDVREDEPESTEVFRLTSVARDVIERWLERDFAHVSQVDRARIAEFSDGNFRVARALADTVERGGSIAQLKDGELFARVFHQRNAPDNQLLHDAQILALVYSFDGEDDDKDGELARLAQFAERSVRDLFGSIAALRGRGVIQSRGRWRALLPQAIANRLAVGAIDRLPPRDLDAFAVSLPPRLLKSASRRIGYLHDDPKAQSIVTRWLAPDGPLGNLAAGDEAGIDVLRNLAPVQPLLALDRIDAELDGADGASVVAPNNRTRNSWVWLAKSLAFEPILFDRAAMVLARFVAAEPADNNNNSASRPFAELFQLHLSGTQASPDQRRAVVRRLLVSNDPDLQRAGELALDALLEVEHFIATSSFDFGARARSHGWRPKIHGEIYSWIDDAIKLAADLEPTVPAVRRVLASNLGGLWRYKSARPLLEEITRSFVARRPWIEGWIAFRSILQREGKDMPDDIRADLLRVIDLTKPVDLPDKARAYVLSSRSLGGDVADGEAGTGVARWQRAADAAAEVGEAMAADPDLMRSFLPEVVSHKGPHRAYEFGRGLAKGAATLDGGWEIVLDAYRAALPKVRTPTVVGGYVAGAAKRDPDWTAAALDAVIDDPDLGRLLPFLQAQLGIDATGLARLTRAIPFGHVAAHDFGQLATGVIRGALAEPLIALFVAMVGMAGGAGQALDILHMLISCADDDGETVPEELLECGRALLEVHDYADGHAMRDHGLGEVVAACLAGKQFADDARVICRRVRAAFEANYTSAYDAGNLLDGLFAVQTEAALDVFLLEGQGKNYRPLLDFDYIRASPLDALSADTLAAWADKDPAVRYAALGRALKLFTFPDMDEATGLSPVFLDLLERVPDKKEFLGDGYHRIHPSGWSGSLAENLQRRRDFMAPLFTHDDVAVREWVATEGAQLDNWIATARAREGAFEESFE